MSLLQEYELLRRIPFFAEIEPARLKLLAFMSERVAFDDGTTLFHQGDQADAAYLIIEGEADIIVETPRGPLTIATLGANDIVGEMAILGDVPRTATVRAKTRLVALRIAKGPFMRMVREFPTMAVSIMRELAHRLELTNNQLRSALSEVRHLRESTVHRAPSEAGRARRRLHEPARQLHPAARGAARLPRSRRRADRRN